MKAISEIIETTERLIRDSKTTGRSKICMPLSSAQLIVDSLKQSSAIPWPEGSAWSEAPMGAYARAVDKNGACYFYLMAFDIDRHGGETQYCGEIIDMTGVNWKETLEFNPSLKSE